jgi:hypothetical protein
MEVSLTRFNSGNVDTKPFHPFSIPPSYLHKETTSHLRIVNFLKETVYSEPLSPLKGLPTKTKHEDFKERLKPLVSCSAVYECLTEVIRHLTPSLFDTRYIPSR